ncbi:PucR family transcriptional regulator [Rossellomorea arthrocnemi]|jgi:PucR family transcriptional regulator, purine catabolism regulatory protein|uniref:PucR family transcriptional regulator n=1 Tax=Rossellomorea arthrocnemi TaxID=2769542 RepID=UPI00191A9978|nr:PucR family transcriptional regulator [Rossellomorea arthrocnemi]
MKSHYYFSVEDIMERKYFEHAKVIAGRKGLGRQVKWVHIVEVTAIKNLLNGNELILSTGLVLQEEGSFLFLIHQLIECDAAAICIELGTNISTIPPAVLKCADEFNFPIIVFEREVPFVSITQDIHAVIINQQYEMIKKLDSFAQNLNQLLLSVNHSRDILQMLHKELDVPVLFQLKEQDVEVLPLMCSPDEEILLQKFRRHKETHEQHFASTKVILFDQEYAELTIYRFDHPFSEYELLILDRTSTALAQYLMRELYFNEQKRLEESKWIMSWLKGDHSYDRLAAFMDEQKSAIHGAVVCICKTPRLEEKESLDFTFFNLLTRSIFEQFGFQVVPERLGNELILILLDTRRTGDWKSRVTNAYEKILKSGFFRDSTHAVFATGKYQLEMMDIHKSYETAKETLKFRSKVDGEGNYYFFDDLHLFRLISIVNENVNLWEMIEEYLSPLLHYDREHDGNLMKTLKVFLSCQGSKQETSKRLFIVRQTLYHRLKKMEDLLGEDFMTSDKRVTIEFLLAAHDYLQPHSFMKKTKIT